MMKVNCVFLAIMQQFLAHLGFPPNQADTIIHANLGLGYIMYLLIGNLADSYTGRYWYFYFYDKQRSIRSTFIIC